jgi:PadR family transcriptional regulator PadR
MSARAIEDRRTIGDRPEKSRMIPPSLAYGNLSSYSCFMARRRPGALLPLELNILEAGLALHAADGDFYGFALARQLSGRTDGSGLASHGTLYKALARMTEAGLLQTEWEDASIAEADGRPRRRLYRVTGEGEIAFRRAGADARATATLGRTAFA